MLKRGRKIHYWQHGTILLDVNVEKMFSVLKVPSEKVKAKMINDVRARVMGLNKTFEQVAHNLKESFCEKFDAEGIINNLTIEENENAKKLASENIFQINGIGENN